MMFGASNAVAPTGMPKLCDKMGVSIFTGPKNVFKRHNNVGMISSKVPDVIL